MLTVRRCLALATALMWGLTLAGCGTADQAAARPSGTETAVNPEPQQPQTPASGAPGTSGDGTWAVIGTSLQGRPIRARTVGHGARQVLFINGVHGDETETTEATAQLPAAFAAAGLDDRVTLTIVEDANPDGRAAGTRENADGVDINRNFPAANFDTSNPTFGSTPLSQPESRALSELIERTTPVLVLSAHSWTNSEFINFDGPGRGIAERFSVSSGLPVQESNSFAPTPGSLGSYVGRDRGTPILTIEVRRGSDAGQVWEKLRAALIEAISG